MPNDHLADKTRHQDTDAEKRSINLINLFDLMDYAPQNNLEDIGVAKIIDLGMRRQLN